MVAHTVHTTPATPDSVATLRATLQLSRENLARLLRVSAKTIERWEASDFLPHTETAGERIAQLLEIVALGQRVLAPSGLRRFLTTPSPALGHRAPLVLVERGEAEAVIGLLASLDAGTGY